MAQGGVEKEGGLLQGCPAGHEESQEDQQGSGKLEECLDGAERSEHGHGLERRGACLWVLLLEVRPLEEGKEEEEEEGSSFGRQSSVGADLGGAARRAAARAARRNQSCDADMQVPDTTRLVAPRETPHAPRSRSRVQRVWTCPTELMGTAP